MSKKNTLMTLLGVCFSVMLFAQIPTPAPKQSQSILLLNATVHVGNGTVIEKAAVGFKDGKILFVEEVSSDKVKASPFDTTIYVDGKHIYPGFIAPNTNLGLIEIEAVRATIDYGDVGDLLPHVRSIVAYNTDSKIIPTVRSNGVLLAQITPTGGIISGTSSIVQLDAWNWEDAVYKLDEGLHLNWSINRLKEEDKTKRRTLLTKFFSDAKAYSDVATHQAMDLQMEAMRGIFDGKKTLFIHANKVNDIVDAIFFAKEYEVKKIVIVGGNDAWRITDMLKENHVAVILNRLHSLPTYPEDDIDLPYKTPFLLQKAGVLYCLNNAGDMTFIATQNLPFYAGTAAAYGLTKEEALMSITSNAAKILGIDKRVGTLEAGKDATLIVSNGDALDMKTNAIELAFIQGRKIDLNNHQKMLYEKFKAKGN